MLERVILEDGVKIVIADKECGITYHRRKRRERAKTLSDLGYLPREVRVNVASEVCEYCLECTKTTGCPGLTVEDTLQGPKIATDLSTCVSDRACARVKACRAALDAGIDPAFRVMDEYEARLEHAQAVESALNRFSREHRSEFQLLAEAWAAEDFAEELRRLDDKLRLAGGAEATLASLPEYHAAESLAAIVTVISEGLAASDAQTAAQATCRDEVREWLADPSEDLVTRLLRLPRKGGD